MSWTKLDDKFTDRPVFETLDFETRWHYLALIQKCSAEERYDGVMPLSKARRASDVTDPDKAHQSLETHSLVEITGEHLRVVEIADHVPPPSVRLNAEKTKVRMRRMRHHKVGDHTLCLPENCDVTADVTGGVTRNPGTGRDGTGRVRQLRTDRGEDDPPIDDEIPIDAPPFSDAEPEPAGYPDPWGRA